MYITATIWMLTPIGLALGTGMLLTYCQITGNWDQWRFLWLYEVWIAVGSVFVPVWLARNKTLARRPSRLLALLLSLVSVACIIVVGWPLIAP